MIRVYILFCLFLSAHTLGQEIDIEPSSPRESDEVVYESAISLEIKEERKRRVAVEYRYLGNLMQAGLEFKVYRQFSLGVMAGKFQGKVAGSDDLGFIPGLRHYAVMGNIYLGKEKSAFSDGLLFRFGTHYNKQEENDLVAGLEVDGQEVLKPGEERFGSQIGLAYHWQWKYVFANVGLEYVTLGPYKNFVPLALSGGFVF